ncbi:MAG: YebC/PmpR family DNA-binding transcriptional regulator [Longimicrobiales bacterium]|nr:YebC/PmpR family DNA-binding transcriptional regulator [Longimicrobiales bacterium]
MAGHNKWSKIKRKKAANDQKKGAIFTKIIREITVAAREGGGDPDMNPRLRLAIDTAKAEEMPSENVERAIKKGTGDLEGVNYEEVTYEGYGPGGVALFIECLTDNQNRTVADIRHALGKRNGSLGTSGSVAWQFERKGRIYVDASRYTEDSVLEAALLAGAEELRNEGDEYLVLTEATTFHTVQDGLREEGVEPASAELAWVAQNEVRVEEGDAGKVIALIESLEELDDVQRVHTNAEIDEETLAAM